MTVQLSSLRVMAEMDASKYVAGMNAKAAADKVGAAGSAAVGQAVAATDAKISTSGDVLARLSRQYVEGYRSEEQFQRGLRQLGRALDSGKATMAQADAILAGMNKRFGMTANATDLAEQGYHSLSQAVAAFNTRLAAQTIAANQAASATQRLASVNMNRSATGLQFGSGFATANIAAQFQDIAVTSAMGMSPLQIALQQGTQLQAVLGPMGAAGAVRTLGSAFLSLISPVSLVTLGLTGLTAAAIQYFFNSEEDISNVNELLKQHGDLIASLKDRYGEAAEGAQGYIAETRAMEAARKAAAAEDFGGALRGSATSLLRDLLGRSASEFGPATPLFADMRASVDELERSIAAGTPKVKEFIDTWSKFQIDPRATEDQRALARSIVESQDAIDGLSAQKALGEIDSLGEAATRNAKRFTDFRKEIDALNKIALPSLSDREQALESYRRATAKASGREAKDDAFAAYQDALRRIENREAGANVPIPTPRPEDIDRFDAFWDTSLKGLGSFTRAAPQFASSAQSVAGSIINVSEAMRSAKLDGISEFIARNEELSAAKARLDDLKSAAEGFSLGSVIAGDAGLIRDAEAALDGVTRSLSGASISSQQVKAAIEDARASLIATGATEAEVNRVLNRFVALQVETRRAESHVDSLSKAIKSIPDRTVTITIKTVNAGGGASRSDYDVPSAGGASSTVGVTRYGGTGFENGFSQTQYDVGGGKTVNVFRSEHKSPVITSNVPVTAEMYQEAYRKNRAETGNPYPPVVRGFASGGFIHPGDTQKVEFFKSPEEAVGIFRRDQMGAIGNALSPAGSTREHDRVYTTLLNIEGNTRKTFGALEDMDGAASSFARSSSGGSSSGAADRTRDDAAWLAAYEAARANYAALGASSRLGIDALAMGPRQIANYAVYGNVRGMGFATGGFISPGDTQRVEFFKRPDEAVGVFTPEQRRAVSDAMSGGDQRPIEVNINLNVTTQSDGRLSPQSRAEMSQAAARGVNAGMRAYHGR
ncbi:hypothetical protein EET67_09895 [Pseudaminobacter arsenicus]|uniref:Bacteriophage tail tape measure N-terminal domain-containing protein n=1 Tax=Borborobacter arsenicus TaxID=1851146 RepID=A0A432V6Y3_9HYPH|nr:phage tail length tape measure family protein [Pseudaminobacter arsenicus]RUM97917.1 hypothetical protein EET67_09895 [Pseudaminobacter arsenicus]